MKKLLSLISTLILFTFCGPKQTQIERIIENGVEIVINHLEPYKIEGKLEILVLEQEMTIDTENDEIAETGLVDIEAFDVDEEGNLYIIRWTSNENFVYKFDNQGRFVKSFVRRGQGPGEIEWGGSVKFISENELMIRDPGKTKYSVYNTEGEFLRDEIQKSHIYVDKIFSNGEHLVSWQDNSPNLENSLIIWVCANPTLRISRKSTHTVSPMLWSRRKYLLQEISGSMELLKITSLWAMENSVMKY